MSSPMPETTNYENAAPSSKRKCCKTKTVGITLMVLGVLLVILGIVYGTVLPSAVNTTLTGAATTCDDSDITERFSDPHGDCELCVPYYYQLHPFHITNAMSAYLDPSVKLKVQEKGPYTYRKFAYKFDVTFEEDVMSYKSYNRYEYQPEMSCEGCSEEDKIMSMSAAYLAVMTKANGEETMVRQVLMGLAQGDETSFNMLWNIENFPHNFLRVLYGLSSMNFVAMATAGQLLGRLASADGLAKLDAATELANAPLSGWEYTGLYIELTVKQTAMGYPNMLAGMGAVSAGKSACKAIEAAIDGDDVMGFCATCNDQNKLSTQCQMLLPACGGCKAAQVIHQRTPALCDDVQKILETQSQSVSQIKSVIAATCGTCLGSFEDATFCLAPMPGAVTGTEPDYNVVELNKADRPISKVNTGCSDIEEVGNHITFEGKIANVLWNANQDLSRYPNADDLNSIGSKSWCGPSKHDDIVCAEILGSDGTSFPPAGADLNGFGSTPAFQSRQLYVSQAKMNVTIFKQEEVSLKGTKLFRYRPAHDLLSAHPWNKQYGTGRPYKGVQNLGYAGTGFLAFLSYPFFLSGDDKFLSDIDLYFNTGTLATPDLMHDKNGEPTPEMLERLSTYLDIEPASGKALNARKRLQASYAVPKLGSGVAISDMTNPNLKAEVIVPIYWGGEIVTVTDVLLEKVQSADTLSSTVLPVLITAIILGVILLAIGIFYIRKHKKSQLAKGQQ